MKNLTKLTLVAVALFTVGNAQAANTQLSGFVAPVCEVTGLASQFDFGAPQAGETLIDVPVFFRCNDGDGAFVELRSSEGGLESDDNEDINYDYTAQVAAPEAGLNLSLTTADGIGPNDQSVTAELGGSAALAGGVTGGLRVTLNETPVFAGGYSDTLAVDITAQ